MHCTKQDFFYLRHHRHPLLSSWHLFLRMRRVLLLLRSSPCRLYRFTRDGCPGMRVVRQEMAEIVGWREVGFQAIRKEMTSPRERERERERGSESPETRGPGPFIHTSRWPAFRLYCMTSGLAPTCDLKHTLKGSRQRFGDSRFRVSGQV